jgi:uncharacterized protein (UPF0303 family)
MIEHTPDSLAAEELALQFDRFTLEMAWAIGDALRTAALERGAAVALDISLRDRPLFHTALPGTDIAHANWIRRKRNTVLALGTSTLAVGMKLAKAGQTLEERYGLAPAEHASDGGGYPLRLRGLGVIGPITASGLPSVEDHRLVTGVIARFV